VINLSTDKPAVLTEAHRLLRPGGRFGVSDVVAENHLDAAQRAERGSYVSCIAGALSIGEYRDGLAAAGFTDITVSPTHQVADGMHSAIIRARKPGSDACCGITPAAHPPSGPSTPLPPSLNPRSLAAAAASPDLQPRIRRDSDLRIAAAGGVISRTGVRR
jgi:arsenite methyltransferase